MEQNPVVKRLYIGGLGHTVSKAELQERFGKFGKVTETEIVTRKDEQGQPTKTFAYINITLSEKELQKCMSALNKTKWKGGTLQIELAKESFLHRLARERQEASVKKERPHSNGMKNILESMKNSGVVNFHLKAVPGTEVPDHKNWVVGKFGRVLPILHLKGQQKNKIIKYDPSKYCHSLKKLDQGSSETVPISQLTWYLEEESDSLSKKRQGQFPVTKKLPKKKMRVQENDSLNRTELSSYYLSSSKTANLPKIGVVQNCIPHKEKQQKDRSVDRQLRTALTSCRNINRQYESDYDSEEEMRAIIAREKVVPPVQSDIEPGDDGMEIVRDDFELKYTTHWSLQKACGAKNRHKECNREPETSENESDYDSDGTNEIIAKTPQKKEKNEVLERSKMVRGGKDDSSERGKTTTFESHDSNGLATDKSKSGGKSIPEKVSYSNTAPEHNSIANKCNSEQDPGSDLYLDTSESERDEDYENMMQSCYRLDLTLEDLKKLASKNMETADEETESNQSDSQSKANESPAHNTNYISKKSAPKIHLAPKKITCPEEIVSAILEDESSDDENTTSKVPPFRGIGSLSVNGMIKELVKGKLDTHDIEDKQDISDFVQLETPKNVSGSQCSGSAINNHNCKSHSLREMNSNTQEGNCIVNPGENSGCSTHKTEESEVESSEMSAISETNLSKVKSLCKRTKMEISAKGSDFVQNQNLKSSPLKINEVILNSDKATSKSNQKHLQDNVKRLAALQERQKERELQKKLIQGALTNLETQSVNKHKHIVFESDSESEAELQENTKESFGKLLGKEFTTKTSGKLFESSEDELDATDEEADRFKIKPQFEGKAGEKLMYLQSRFGTDERFRMDTRFLESDSEQEDEPKKMEMDEEEELALEKKKNLEIMKNLLNINLELPKPSKQAANAKKFKDINALRYDPTRQDHAVFERKPENTEKESKAEKKKKWEEVHKLPEVSKEIFYDVAVDLKEVLGSTKYDEKPEEITWDKPDNMEQGTPAQIETLRQVDSHTGSKRQDEMSGFTFSFFSAEEEKSPKREEPYVTETIKPSRVVWQEDPRFQDSSSEEDDELEIVEDVKETSSALPHPNVRFFFFTRGDDRLKEGPKLFCKPLNLDAGRDDWESRRQMLLEDCRKKHKDARRKIKAKQ
ncbi:nucleolar protein 8 [Hemicordylus capensis]|uniref:nucleolar protein 8 n=1 Tax=Hemicordylus capensis TaxID=884348 RepID=UPI002303C669|nr:nucleolar protein 8 [Hemicordylus capensis]